MTGIMPARFNSTSAPQWEAPVAVAQDNGTMHTFGSLRELIEVAVASKLARIDLSQPIGVVASDITDEIIRAFAAVEEPS